MPVGVAVLLQLIFERIKRTRISLVRSIADAFVVKHEGAAATGWPRGIKAIIFIHRHVILARDVACPIIVLPDAVRVRSVDRRDEVLAHQVSAVIGAPEALQCAILQRNGLEFRKDLLTQFASCSAAHDITNGESYRANENNYESDPKSLSFHEGMVLSVERNALIYNDVNRRYRNSYS